MSHNVFEEDGAIRTWVATSDTNRRTQNRERFIYPFWESLSQTRGRNRRADRKAGTRHAAKGYTKCRSSL